jgi:hypothetical protein
MIKTMLEESHGVLMINIRWEEPCKNDGRIEAHESRSEFNSSLIFSFHFSRENSLLLVEVGSLALAIACRGIEIIAK